MDKNLNDISKSKETLKHLILELHKGQAPDIIKKRLVEMMQKVPYSIIVEVEQELINEGLPHEEVLKLCDIHTLVLEGNIDHSGSKTAPEGHPVHTFLMENEALLSLIKQIDEIYEQINSIDEATDCKPLRMNLWQKFNLLFDVEKHYQKKENLVFPFLEKHGITGPPKVMWGKHDETRQLLKSAIKTLSVEGNISAEELKFIIELILKRASSAVQDMIFKENEILFPMALDALSEQEWYEIYKQTDEIGYCLYDPLTSWNPINTEIQQVASYNTDSIRFSTGSLNLEELQAIFNTLPIDLTFVDKDDKVKYFSLGKERIFQRNRAILKRDVRLCHPPSSVHVVEKILSDFREGKENKAQFWINFQGKFVLIEYYAVRNENGEYLGTLEVTQDLTFARSLEGEQRLLSYSK